MRPARHEHAAASRPGSRTLVATALTLALAGCATQTVAAPQSPTASAAAAAPASPTVTARPAPAWSILPAAPLPELTELTGAWTGKEFVVVGSDSRTPGSDGKVKGYAAAFDPATRRWRTLAAPPAREVTQAQAQSVWTGTELVVWGGAHREVLDLAANRWRELPAEDRNAPPGGSALVWTGSRVIGFGGGCCASVVDSAGSLDPATGRWEALPKGPLPPRTTGAVWTGTEVVFAGGFGEAPDLSVSDALVPLDTAAAYNPATHAWRSLPTMPFAGDATLSWDGEKVVAAGTAAAATWSPRTGVWTPLPKPRQKRDGGFPVLAGDQLVIVGGTLPDTDPDHPVFVPGEVLPPAGRAWQPLPKVDGLQWNTVVVWTGTQLLVFDADHKPHLRALTV